jgi:hypothetical protein
MFVHPLERRSLVGIAAGALLCSLLQACVAASSVPPPRGIIVSGPPPAPLVEEASPRTQPLAVWIGGYWHWTGIQYAWIPGHWEAPPPSGARWRAPRYVKTEGAYVYEPGRWWLGTETPAQANAFH